MYYFYEYYTHLLYSTSFTSMYKMVFVHDTYKPHT